MRLVTFSDANGMRIGVHDAASNTIVDLAATTRLPKDMTSFIALGKNGLKRARAAVRSGEGRLPFGGVRLHAPIPRPAKNILYVGENYYDHVYGYTIINDATARTLQNRHRQWFLGKSLDGYCPMGPCIVTADEVPDVTKLRLITRVNGEVRQDALLSQLIFDIPTLIETLSRVMTLDPGDSYCGRISATRAIRA